MLVSLLLCNLKAVDKGTLSRAGYFLQKYFFISKTLPVVRRRMLDIHNKNIQKFSGSARNYVDP